MTENDTPLEEAEMGWFYVDAQWNLYVEGTLTKVYVDYIYVDEAAHSDGYIVTHYDRVGDPITTVNIDAEEVRDGLRDADPAGCPRHI